MAAPAIQPRYLSTETDRRTNVEGLKRLPSLPVVTVATAVHVDRPVLVHELEDGGRQHRRRRSDRRSRCSDWRRSSTRC